MPRKNCKPGKSVQTKSHLFTVFGVEVNLSAVLTSVFGTISCTLVGWGLVSLHTMMNNITVMNRDVPVMEATLARLVKEYPPLPKPDFNASIKSPSMTVPIVVQPSPDPTP